MEILYRDARLLVCVKPVGADSEHDMPRLLMEQEGLEQCFCVHRLDREAGGVMVYALDGKAAARLTELFAGHSIVKEYLAVCSGSPAPAGEMTDLLYHDKRTNKTFVVDRERKGVKEARLNYRVLGTVRSGEQTLSLLRILLETGRSHQIRVQMASRGYPLAGDRRYGSTIRMDGIALRCARLAFTHPFTGKPLDCVLPAVEGFPWDNWDAKTYRSSPEA